MRTSHFLTTVSISGVPGIFSGNSYLFKIFFGALMLGLFGLGFWNIVLAVNDYYNYDVTSNIKTENPKSVVFPAITICTPVDFTQKTYNKTTDEFLFSQDYVVHFEKFPIFLNEAKFFTKINNRYDKQWNIISVKEELEFFVLFWIIDLFCIRFNADSNKEINR